MVVSQAQNGESSDFFLSCHRALLDLTKNLEIPAAGYDTDTLSKLPVRPTALAEKKVKTSLLSSCAALVVFYC